MLILSPNAYSKRVKVFLINDSLINNKLLYQLNKKYYTYINILKDVLPSI
jgi:hypothetical protein